MTIDQKSFVVRGARKATLADVMLGNLMKSSAATTAITNAALVVFGTMLLAVSAQFKIPLYPVPVTGQTLVVLLIGMSFGPRLGGITIAAYLFEGAIGLPVFAGGTAGPAVFLGPTGGYLFGFFLSGVAVGYLANRGMGRSILSTIVAMVIGNIIIYLCGVAWLTNFIDFGKAVAAGVLPFLYGDALKIAIAAGLMPLAWRFIKSVQR